MSLLCEADSLDDILHTVYEHILEHGHAVQSTKGRSIETIGATLVLRNPLNRISRTEARYLYVTPLAELCWYLSGSNQADAIIPYLPVYGKLAEPDGTIYGGYGPRIFGEGENRQVCNAIERLRAKPSSRRVVIQILDKTDVLQTHRKDIPCTTTIQFLVRANQLHTIVTMRSNDAWRGLLHDVFAFTMIQELAARDLGYDLGTYTHFASSLHLYNDDIDSARSFVAEGFQATMHPMDAMPSGSPWEGVRQLKLAEKEARTQEDPTAIHIPTEKYWADLSRILIAYNLRQKGAENDARRVRNEISLQPISELLQRRATRGAG